MNIFASSRLGRASAKRPFLGMERGGGTIFRVWESLIDPWTTVLVLLSLMVWFRDEEYAHYVILSVLIFALTFPGKTLLQETLTGSIREVFFGWCWVAGLLGFFGLATGFYKLYPQDLLRSWLWMAPLAQFASHLLFRISAPMLLAAGGYPKRAVVVGCNELGKHLVAEINAHPMQGIKFEGYFDDRVLERLNIGDSRLLGKFSNVSEYVKSNGTEVIYLALPMTTQPRVLALLESLNDTTASVYFVPDIFVTDLIQGRMDLVGRIPVLAVCDTPFSGVNSIFKRASDICFALLILLLVSPVFLAVALLVKLTSPGPVIFKQRRYGLDGKEIIVYKFRSMTVVEDGDKVYKQVEKNDSRISPIGGFLRKTSLDELPQFINVLQGTMSIVGPRPHAIAVNEYYRKHIPGYMVRHKVRPGITGWAQVNGFRGGDDLDSMRSRIECDLEYLRNWSLQLDIYVMIRTVLLVLKDSRAF